MKIRIKFAKTDTMRFIGHLDVMRFFQKAVRRAGIDPVYSGGYSPHPIMSFAAPLGVGLESMGEYMDLEVNAMVIEGVDAGSEDIKEKLNAVMVPGMRILHVTRLDGQAKNAMASVAAAAYDVRFREGHEPKTDWVGHIDRFCGQQTIPVKKRTKKKELIIDLKPAIYSLKVSKDRTVHMLVDASSSGSVKPGMIMEAFVRFLGLEPKEFSLEIMRRETFTRREAHLVPLDEIGEEF